MVALAVGVLAVSLLAPDVAYAASNRTPVNCADIAMTFDAQGYDVACDSASEMLADLDGTMASQHLEATAGDSSSFIDAFHYSFLGQVTYTATDLRSNFESLYGKLDFKDWHSGRTMANLATAEFKADMRGLPSNCVAFQKLGHPQWGGYKKIMVGIACSQENIDQAYAVLKRLYLPN